MNAEFNWWLLIVGLVIGGGLVWLVLLDARRRGDEIDARERAVEAAWLADVLAEEGTTLSPALAGRVLELHAAYLTMSDPPEAAAGEVPEARPVAAPGDVAEPEAGRAPSEAGVPREVPDREADPTG